MIARGHNVAFGDLLCDLHGSARLVAQARLAGAGEDVPAVDRFRTLPANVRQIDHLRLLAGRTSD